MDENRPWGKKRCAAMIAANIHDPESKDGIDFCVNQCPYDYCVVFEDIKAITYRRARGRTKLAKELRAHGVSVEDIVLILHVSIRNVQRYLKK